MSGQWITEKEAQSLLEPGQWFEPAFRSWGIIRGEPTPEKTEEEPQVENVFDIFTVQESTRETLQDILDKQRPESVYINPQAPRPRSPNYLLYIGIGIGILFLSGKIKGFKL